MLRISDIVKLKSGNACFVYLKSTFEATRENSDRLGFLSKKMMVF